jgi:hypothetical protein
MDKKCLNTARCLSTHKFHLMMSNNSHLYTTTFQRQPVWETSIKISDSILKWMSGASWRDLKILKMKRKRKWKRIKWRCSSKKCLICFNNRDRKWTKEKMIK